MSPEGAGEDPAVQRRRTAIHEAGHVVAGLLVGAPPVVRVTVRPDGPINGRVTRDTAKALIPGIAAPQELVLDHARSVALVSLAGHSAEVVAGYRVGPEHIGISTDVARVLKQLKHSELFGSSPEEGLAILFRETLTMMSEPLAQAAVLDVARVLLELDTVEGEQLEAMLARARQILGVEGGHIEVTLARTLQLLNAPPRPAEGV